MILLRSLGPYRRCFYFICSRAQLARFLHYTRCAAMNPLYIFNPLDYPMSCLQSYVGIPPTRSITYDLGFTRILTATEVSQTWIKSSFPPLKTLERGKHIKREQDDRKSKSSFKSARSPHHNANYCLKKRSFEKKNVGLLRLQHQESSFWVL